MRLLDAYRRSGADLPFGDPGRAHGVAMEGYYWRITDAVRGRVVVALCGACRAPDGPWAMVALAVHPEGVVRSAVWNTVAPDTDRLGVSAGGLLRGGPDAVSVDLGPDARLQASFEAPRTWPARRAFGGTGPAQCVPRLPQYWHPHLLGAGVRGELHLGGEPIALDGATAYAEKNWGSTFSHHWWWGQAQAFPDADACVAFAGGRVALAGVRAAPTAVVVRIEDQVLRLAPPLARTVAAVGRDGWRVRARSATHSVEIEGDAAGSVPAILPVPAPAERTTSDRSHQVLGGRMTVTVRRGSRLLLHATSPLAGLERAIDLGDP